MAAAGLAWCLLSGPVFADGGTKTTLLNEDQATSLLLGQLEHDRAFEMRCVAADTDAMDDASFTLELRGLSGKDCAGSANASTVLGRFRVDRLTKTISWQDHADEWRPYSVFIKERRDELE